MWLGPCMAMIQTVFPSEFLNYAVASANMMKSLAGGASVYTIGYLDGITKSDENPRSIGTLITCFITVSYLVSGPLFITAAYKYKKYILKHREKAAEKVSKLKQKTE